MKYHVVNISDIEELITSKIEIDKLLIESNAITEKMDLNYFLQKYATLSNTYISQTKVIAFNFYNIEDNKYLFINEKNETSDKLVSELEKINYDLSKLVDITSGELVNTYGNIEEISYFVINNTIKILPENIDQ